MAKRRFTASVRILPDGARACVRDVETGSTSQDTYYREVTIEEIVDWLEFEVSIREGHELICIGVAISHPDFKLRETEQHLHRTFNVPVLAIEDEWRASHISTKETAALLEKISESLADTGDPSAMTVALIRAVTLQ